MPPRPTHTPSAGTGQRPWPGITSPDCHYCSWAYRGRWPAGRMEVKYVNALCTNRGHRLSFDGAAPAPTASPSG